MDAVVINNPSVVVIRNDAGEVVMIASEHEGGGLTISRATDSNFDRVCWTFGIMPPKVKLLKLPAPPDGSELIR